MMYWTARLVIIICIINTCSLMILAIPPVAKLLCLQALVATVRSPKEGNRDVVVVVRVVVVVERGW